MDRGSFIILIFIPNCTSVTISGRGESILLLLNAQCGFEVGTFTSALDNGRMFSEIKEDGA
jgi:hypothetical protein